MDGAEGGGDIDQPAPVDAAPPRPWLAMNATTEPALNTSGRDHGDAMNYVFTSLPLRAAQQHQRIAPQRADPEAEIDQQRSRCATPINAMRS